MKNVYTIYQFYCLCR